MPNQVIDPSLVQPELFQPNHTDIEKEIVKRRAEYSVQHEGEYDHYIAEKNIAEIQNIREQQILQSVSTTSVLTKQYWDEYQKKFQESNGNIYDPYWEMDNLPNDEDGEKNNGYNRQYSEDGPTTGGGLQYLYPHNSVHALQASSLDGIFGIPYQFLDSVDRRILPKDKNSLGRKYIEKIMVHAPLLMITPCRQEFMPGFASTQQKEAFTSLLTGDLEFINNIANNMDKIGRYYTTRFAYPEYYEAVRLMCKEVAYFLGIDKIKINYGGTYTQIGDIDWYNQKNSAFSNYFAAKNATVWYVDGLVELSDSFSNSTAESSLASSANGIGEQIKELRFLASNSTAKDWAEKIANGAIDAVNTVAKTFTPDSLEDSLVGGMLNDLKGAGAQTIMRGGKLIFPKIWGDSSNSRSYSFNIKLRSPDHDTVSIFFNVLVPYIHLLALTLPQSLTESTAAHSPNAYDTPFLVRAYCKGMFNINMGIITDLSATRGAESQWNDQGLPTQIDVNINIEDLYSNLVMSNPRHGENNIFQNMWNSHMDIITNTEMVDFLSNLAGLNIAASAVTRKLELLAQLTMSRIKWTPSKIWHYFENGASNMIRAIHDKIS